MCVCQDAAAAAPVCKWRSAVRVGPNGLVLEPANGTFDVTVAPGEDVQAAVDRCPPGGSVLLLPGPHDGPLVLSADKVVHVFGRGRATLRTAMGAVLTSEAVEASVDGLVIRREAGGGFNLCDCVWIKRGGLRLQACDVASAAGGHCCLAIDGGSDPLVTACKCEQGVACRSLLRPPPSPLLTPPPP